MKTQWDSPHPLSPSQGPFLAGSPQTPPCGGVGRPHGNPASAPGLRVRGPHEQVGFSVHV